MNNPRLAGRYAKSILDLAVEQNQLEEINADMRFLATLSKSNPDFVAMLKSPVITSDKKQSIITAIISGRVNKLTDLFVKLLINKNRESNLPEIANAFVDQYNSMNNIFKIKLKTATPISEALQNQIVDKIRTDKALERIELDATVDERLIGGFTLQLGDSLIDASVNRDLMDIKRQFLSNAYIHNIR